MADQPTHPTTPTSICPACGRVFQTVGLILFLGTCCWWPFTNFTQQEIKSTEPSRLMPLVSVDAPLSQRWVLTVMIVSVVSGLALMVVGLGVQFERRNAARAAMWLTAFVGLLFWIYVGWAVFRAPAVMRIVAASFLALVWTGLFVVAGAAAAHLKKYPPPIDSESSLSSHDEAALRRDLSPHQPE